MNKKNLSPKVASALGVLAALDAGLRVAGTSHLDKHGTVFDPTERQVWNLALKFVNSGGIVPIAYFVRYAMLTDHT